MPRAEPCPASHVDTQGNSSGPVADVIFMYKRRPGFKKNKTESQQTSSADDDELGSSEHHSWAWSPSAPLDKSPLGCEVSFPGRRALVSHRRFLQDQTKTKRLPK